MELVINNNSLLLRKIKVSATITTILGILSVFSLIFLFLALSDIADNEPDLTLEWYIAGVCIIILSVFTISTFVTVKVLFQLFGQRT